MVKEQYGRAREAHKLLIEDYKTRIQIFAKTHKKEVLDQRILKALMANDAVRAKASEKDKKFKKLQQDSDSLAVNFDNADIFPFKNSEFELAELLSSHQITRPCISLLLPETAVFEIVEKCTKKAKYLPKIQK